MSSKLSAARPVVNNQREAEVLIAQGQTIGRVCQQIGVTDQMFYRRRASTPPAPEQLLTLRRHGKSCSRATRLQVARYARSSQLDFERRRQFAMIFWTDP